MKLIKLTQFSEADQANQIKEIINGLSAQSVAFLTTNVMKEVNQLCGDYLEEELKLHLGAEKYTAIANGQTVSLDELQNSQLVEAGKFCTN